MPAITQKLYQAVIAEMIKLPFDNPERHRLAVIQRQLADAQQVLFATKTLDAWIKAG